MQITRITDASSATTISTREPLTSDDLQREIDYWRAEKILQNMLKMGLVSQDELNKIRMLNRHSFSPLYAQIMP